MKLEYVTPLEGGYRPETRFLATRAMLITYPTVLYLGNIDNPWCYRSRRLYLKIAESAPSVSWWVPTGMVCPSNHRLSWWSLIPQSRPRFPFATCNSSGGVDMVRFSPVWAISFLLSLEGIADWEKRNLLGRCIRLINCPVHPQPICTCARTV